MGGKIISKEVKGCPEIPNSPTGAIHLQGLNSSLSGCMGTLYDQGAVLHFPGVQGKRLGKVERYSNLNSGASAVNVRHSLSDDRDEHSI